MIVADAPAPKEHRWKTSSIQQNLHPFYGKLDVNWSRSSRLRAVFWGSGYALTPGKTSCSDPASPTE